MSEAVWGAATALGVATVIGLIIWGLVREYHDPHSYHELYRMLRETAHDAARTSVELIEARGLLKEYEDGHNRNMKRMELARVEPAWRPTRTAKEISNGGSKLLPLYDLLYDSFSDDELFDLAFRIGLPRDGVAGETHAAKTQCVIEYADRRNIVAELIRVGKVERPELAWPEIQEDL
jgi:hypothetical protein